MTGARINGYAHFAGQAARRQRQRGFALLDAGNHGAQAFLHGGDGAEQTLAAAAHAQLMAKVARSNL